MSSFEHIHFAEIILIVSGIVYTLHGLIHQLIVGAAVGFFQLREEKQSRLILMMWIATGAFMSFLGFLPAILILLFGPQPPVVATLIAETIAVCFLSLHIFLSGYRTHTQPVKIGFFFSLGFVIVLLFYLLNLWV
ncbi:hypothetical protein QMM42_14660 [Leptospira santarosai]|uniref:Uncharacterized protein n=1 Tax=Leptospira santarosai serovar Shermani str. LT 821 TaxID=758847 RepID=K8Y8X0_9LEPT|nr:hypothetical protein [Leptospira santarosai]EKT86185.1 hypothetical protein LSS_13909 [Leptospira santarosai serovar Shermani str. LT 821]EMM76533.1 hypothetical protein LEP1GSC040_1251 [Leptospira santarosai str. 2000030832]EMO85313.1 hypothetical protein LEP1GSC070_1796 [Leptospira santarosai str. AIM]EPG81102.1 hypothetical protein LEP1GSC048_4002 [Leptospira santarosai serovar Shermani str. 1342KT]MDI7187433.1 hypothetical protein [Leptospira santarosai]